MKKGGRSLPFPFSLTRGQGRMIGLPSGPSGASSGK